MNLLRPDVQMLAARLDAARRLGSRSLAGRLIHEIDLRSGLAKRRMPQGDWPCAGELGRLGVVDSGSLRRWLDANAGVERVAELRRHLERVRTYRFDVFGESVEIRGWNHDGIANVEYDPSAHWTEIHEVAGADLKCVWEPSRFAWAFDLVRLELLDSTSGAAATFWNLLDDWCTSNPPNTGVQWVCGQEASIRLLAVALCADAIDHTATEDDHLTLARFVHASGERIAATIRYARSQRNNHLSSEAMGLAVAATLMPASAARRRWQRLSDDAYREVEQQLVFADGGSSQYSTNYHRMFVEALIVADLLARRSQKPARDRKALARSSSYLEALAVSPGGTASFHGHDDGARILPLTQLPHRSLADTLQLTHLDSDAKGVCADGADESCAWFGLAIDDGLTGLPRSPDAHRIRSFSDAGVHILTEGGFTVIVRAGVPRFRPAHADQLNIELWYEGKPISVDRGTAAYSGPNGADDRFVRSDHHSTVVLDEGDHMTRVGRFLWAHWVSAQVVHVCEGSGFVEFSVEARLGPRSALVRRDLVVTAEQVVVTDIVEPSASGWSTRWQLHEQHADWLEAEASDHVVPKQPRALSYRQLVNDVVVVERRPTRGHVRSIFRRPA